MALLGRTKSRHFCLLGVTVPEGVCSAHAAHATSSSQRRAQEDGRGGAKRNVAYVAPGRSNPTSAGTTDAASALNEASPGAFSDEEGATDDNKTAQQPSAASWRLAGRHKRRSLWRCTKGQTCRWGTPRTGRRQWGRTGRGRRVGGLRRGVSLAEGGGHLNWTQRQRQRRLRRCLRGGCTNKSM
jgi:hypothetical protein